MIVDKQDISRLNRNLASLNGGLQVLLKFYNEQCENSLAIREKLTELEGMMLELRDVVEAVLVVNMPNDVAEIEGTE